MQHSNRVFLTTCALVAAGANGGQALAAAPAASDGIEEIIITAERREQSLQRAPIAITAVTADILTDRGVSNAADLTKIVPSVTFNEGGAGSNQVTVRGIGALAGNGMTEQVVGFNMDGTYLARTASASGLYFDLDRIEVLKGPQGTLYGRNATAGAVNVISRKPTLDAFGADLSLTLGDYDLKKGEAAFNIPVSSTVGFRLAGQAVDRDGYLSDGYNDQEHESGRLSLLVQPSDRFSLNLVADYSHAGGQGFGGVPSPYVDSSDPYLGPSDPKLAARFNVATIPNPFFPLGPPFLQGHSQPRNNGYVDNTNTSFYGSADWKTGIGTFTAIPSYRQIEVDSLHYGAGFAVSDKEDFDNQSLELRYASPEQNALRGVFGVYYFDESGEITLLADTLDLLGVPPTRNRVDETTTTAKALFGQATLDVTDTVRLIAGLRYSEEDKEFRGSVFGAPFSGDQDFSSTDYKVGFEVDVAEQSMLYATVGTGFKAGGFYIAAEPNTFKPETITAWTVGSKNRFLDNRLQFNAELFYWDYKDKQVSHLGPVNPDPARLLNLITENAGRAEFYGVEIESQYLVTDADLLSVNVQYEHSEYEVYRYQQSLLAGPPLTSCSVGAPNAALFVTVDCSGNEAAQAPNWSLALSYSHTQGLSNGADLVYTLSGSAKSSFWIGEEHLVGQEQDSYGKLDLSLGYKSGSGRWSLTGYVDNATDEAVVSSSFVDSIAGIVVAGIEPPRTWGVRANVKF